MNSTLILQIKTYLPKLFFAIIVLALGWFLAGKLTKIIIRTMKKAKIESSIISFSKSIFKIVLRIVVIVAALATLGVNVTSLVAALGAAFVTIGIALKDSLSNVASGAIIIINKPFKVGDFLEVSDNSGTVSNIELIFTTIITPDNKELIIPNSRLTSSSIINCSKTDKKRITFSYKLKNIKALKLAKSKIETVLSKNDKILCNPTYKITVGKCDLTGVELKLSVWCLNSNYDELKVNLQEEIQLELEKFNIEEG